MLVNVTCILTVYGVNSDCMILDHDLIFANGGHWGLGDLKRVALGLGDPSCFVRHPGYCMFCGGWNLI